jgi:hypothetical protein
MLCIIYESEKKLCKLGTRAWQDSEVRGHKKIQHEGASCVTVQNSFAADDDVQ